MSIAQQTLGTTSTVLYTSNAGSAITAIYLLNDHASEVTVQVHVVPSGGTASASNKIIKDLKISAGDTYIVDTERLIFDDGDFISASCDVDAVVHSTISYIGV